jgi:sugar-specific transcriptional regulator TrmB
MSRPTNAIKERHNELIEEAEQRRKEFKQAKKQLKGNPELVQAIESLEGELDAIREALNLDI